VFFHARDLNEKRLDSFALISLLDAASFAMEACSAAWKDTGRNFSAAHRKSFTFLFSSLSTQAHFSKAWAVMPTASGRSVQMLSFARATADFKSRATAERKLRWKTKQNCAEKKHRVGSAQLITKETPHHLDRVGRKKKNHAEKATSRWKKKKKTEPKKKRRAGREKSIDIDTDSGPGQCWKHRADRRPGQCCRFFF